MQVGGQRHATPRPLYPQERPDIYCTEGWMGPRAGLDECGISRPHPVFGTRNVQPVTCRYTDWAISVYPHPVLCVTITEQLRIPYNDWVLELSNRTILCPVHFLKINGICPFRTKSVPKNQLIPTPLQERTPRMVSGGGVYWPRRTEREKRLMAKSISHFHLEM